MNQQEAWAPVLTYLAEQGFPLPDTVQIQVAGHTLTVEVPEELKSAPSS
jgi:hypothetical protein